MPLLSFMGVDVSKLLIIRDPANKQAIDGALPAGWTVMAVGEDIYPRTMGPYETIVCGCELYTDLDWQWYHTVVRQLSKDKDKKPLWTT